jgi:UDP-N-acetylmuramoyl-L-alanyl-D-glutamate--2,6-diaminopimelate ligase
MTTLRDIMATQHLQTSSEINAIRDHEVLGVTADSRVVRQGDLFVAVIGGQIDGHDYALAAAERGASAIIGSVPESILRADGRLPASVPYIQVQDGRAALASISAQLFGYPSRSMTVIGITGTDGKTTTSSLLESILVAATSTPQDPDGSVGVITTVGARIRGQESDTGLHVTTPDAPQVQRFLADMRSNNCRYAIVESTSHGLHQQRVAAVAFDVAVVTNITHEHLDYHGTRDAYVAAKGLLFRALLEPTSKEGVERCAVLNADDAGSYGALQAVLQDEAAKTGRTVHVRAYGVGDGRAELDVAAEDVTYRPDGTYFTLRWWGGEIGIVSQLIGEFNVSNVLAAATAALSLGIEPEKVRVGIATFAGVLGRMQRMDHGQDFLAIVDFAHSPASLERALKTLRPLVGVTRDGASGRLIAVFGSAGLRDKAKRKWMGQVSGRLADFTIITAEDPRTEDVNDICREIEEGVREFVSQESYLLVPDRSEAIQAAVNMAHAGDIVAAFGKGHERSMCYGVTEHPWSDQEAMLAALKLRMEQSGR